MSLKKWFKVSSEVVIKNNHWMYNRDVIIRDDGVKGEYHYVHTEGSTMVIPVSENGDLVLTNQFRYLNNKESIEFPCGGVEPGLTHKENAIKELREETGFNAENLYFIGEFSPYTGASDEMTSVFIAEGLFPSPLEPDATEEIELLYFSPQEFDKMIDDGIVWDGLSISAWTKVRKRFL